MLANLRALFGCVIDIILLRRGPEALPTSRELLLIVVALNVAIAMALSAATSAPVGATLLQMLVSCAVMLLWFHGALVLAKKRERFLQTMTALFAVNAIFLPVIMPLYRAVAPYLEKPDPNVPPPAMLGLLLAFTSIWALVVEVRIVRAAFECPWIGAVLLIFGEALFAIVVFALLFGVAAKAA